MKNLIKLSLLVIFFITLSCEKSSTDPLEENPTDSDTDINNDGDSIAYVIIRTNIMPSNVVDEHWQVYKYDEYDKLLSVDYYSGPYPGGVGGLQRTEYYRYMDGLIISGPNKYYLNADSLIYQVESNASLRKYEYNENKKLVGFSNYSENGLSVESIFHWNNDNRTIDTNLIYYSEKRYKITHYNYSLQLIDSINRGGLNYFGEKSKNLVVRSVDSYYDSCFVLDMNYYHKYEYEFYNDSIVRIEYFWNDLNFDSLNWYQKDIYVTRKMSD